MIRVSCVKLGKSRKAAVALERTLVLLRLLYNACIEQRRETWRKGGVHVSRYDQQKELTELRQEDERYRQLPAEMTRATVTTRVDLAFKAFFRRVKAGEKPGFPRNIHDRGWRSASGSPGAEVMGTTPVSLARQIRDHGRMHATRPANVVVASRASSRGSCSGGRTRKAPVP